MKFLYRLKILILLAFSAQICATHLTPENFKAVVAADVNKLLSQAPVLKSEGHYVLFDITEKNNGIYEIAYRHTLLPEPKNPWGSWQMRQSIENFIEKYTTPTLVCVHELVENPQAYAELLVKIAENVVALECLYEFDPYVSDMQMRSTVKDELEAYDKQLRDQYTYENSVTRFAKENSLFLGSLLAIPVIFFTTVKIADNLKNYFDLPLKQILNADLLKKYPEILKMPDCAIGLGAFTLVLMSSSLPVLMQYGIIEPATDKRRCDYDKKNALLEQIICLKIETARHHAAEYLKKICKNAELDDKDVQAAIVAHAAALS